MEQNKYLMLLAALNIFEFYPKQAYLIIDEKSSNRVFTKLSNSSTLVNNIKTTIQGKSLHFFISSQELFKLQPF